MTSDMKFSSNVIAPKPLQLLTTFFKSHLSKSVNFSHYFSLKSPHKSFTLSTSKLNHKEFSVSDTEIPSTRKKNLSQDLEKKMPETFFFFLFMTNNSETQERDCNRATHLGELTIGHNYWKCTHISQPPIIAVLSIVYCNSPSLSGKKRIPSVNASIKYKKVDAGKLLRNGKLYATLGRSREREKRNMPKDPHYW